MTAPMDLSGRLIDYENGELDDDDTVALFADLIRTGLAWRLQGHYGRQAAGLIKAGAVTADGRVRDWKDRP